MEPNAIPAAYSESPAQSPTIPLYGNNQPSESAMALVESPRAESSEPAQQHDHLSADYPPVSPLVPASGWSDSWANHWQAGPSVTPAAPWQAPVAAPPRRRILPALLGVLGVVVLLAVLAGTFALGRSSGTSPSVGSVGNTNGTAAPVVVPAAAQDLQQTIINVVSTVQPSVVEITSTGSQAEATGSGEILTSDGYIVTNDHVVAGFSTFNVRLSNGVSYPAHLTGQDPQDDLAVLKVDATNLQPIAFADSSAVRVGQFAVALGSPLGLNNSATFGLVSALNRTESEGSNGPAAQLSGLIQTSAAINPGNSGGALVDLQGRLIGVPTLGAISQQTGAANDIGFAIASNRVKFVADQLIKNGHLTSSGQGFLGIKGQDVTTQLAASQNLSTQSGVLVGGFAADASGKNPAQAAGMQSGDIITAINGQTISGSSDIASAVQTQQPGARLAVTVQRGGSRLTLNVTLGERPLA